MDNIDEKFYDIINGEDWWSEKANKDARDFLKAEELEREDSAIDVSSGIYGSLLVPSPMPGVWLNIMFVDGPELFDTGDIDKQW